MEKGAAQPRTLPEAISGLPPLCYKTLTFSPHGLAVFFKQGQHEQRSSFVHTDSFNKAACKEHREEGNDRLLARGQGKQLASVEGKREGVAGGNAP